LNPLACPIFRHFAAPDVHIATLVWRFLLVLRFVTIFPLDPQRWSCPLLSLLFLASGRFAPVCPNRRSGRSVAVLFFPFPPAPPPLLQKQLFRVRFFPPPCLQRPPSAFFLNRNGCSHSSLCLDQPPSSVCVTEIILVPC